MRRPKAGEIWTSSGTGPAYAKVKVVEVLGNFLSYADSSFEEDARCVPGFVEEFVRRYSPPPIELPDAQAILPLTATGFRPATYNMGLHHDPVLALVKVTVANNIVSVSVEDPG